MNFAKWLFLLNLIYLVLTHQAFSKVSVSDIGLQTKQKEGTLIINYSGKLLEYPEMNIVGNTIQIVIPDAEVKKAIDKSVSFATSSNDTRISAYQVNKTTIQINTDLPFDMKKHKDKVSMQISEGKIELNLPKLKASKALATKKVVKEVKKEEKKVLDKNYLDALLALEKKEEKPKKEPRLVLEDKKGEVTIAGAKTAAPSVDVVKTSQASTAKIGEASDKATFSLVGYAGKFVAFLGGILLLFYGVVTLMKKGVIKKGKLGFLNNTDNVVVLSNTFVGPKKSLMLIKAHKQVFLVSNTEHGMQLISEVKDVAGLFKEGEKSLAGTNFDITLDETNDNEVESTIKLKEDITKSNNKASVSSYLDAKERVKFSDQLKKKVKNLKPLQ